MSDQALTPEDLVGKYNETWEIFLSNQREPYILNELEYAVFNDALLRGIKGVVSFDWGAINTSFFVSSFRKSRKLKEEYMPEMIEAPKQRELTPEESERNLKRIQEIKDKLRIKVSMS